jgi:hypothetical protein
MKYRTRTYYSDSQKAVMWERWKPGAEDLLRVATAFEVAGEQLVAIAPGDEEHRQ